MDRIKIISLEAIDSTNSYLHDYRGEEGELMTIVTARFQTAGRGQGRNSWESERDKNLLMSIKVRPVGLPIERQYVMLEAMALAIRKVVEDYVVRETVTGNADNVTIKWPNDIYVGDRKISGTLSECSFSGKFIDDCILGSGINVNQEVFLSDAPNPISLKQIVGKDLDPNEVLSAVIGQLEQYLHAIDSGNYSLVHTLYLSHLYRRQGYHPYRDKDGCFLAKIVDVQPNGLLSLERSDGSLSVYAFKDVEFLLTSSAFASSES